MDHTRILPDIGDAVVLDFLDEDKLSDASIGEIGYAMTMLGQRFAQRMADPALSHEVATYCQAPGADWSGLQIDAVPANTDEQASDEADVSLKSVVGEPVPPDNYSETIQALGMMLAQQDRLVDACLVNYTQHLHRTLGQQTKYLGAPYDASPFRDAKHYLREAMQLSTHRAKKLDDRASYFTYTSGANPDLLASQPKFAGVATALAEGKIPAENADHIMSLDTDLTKYAAKVGQSTEFKDQLLQAFEPTLVEAAETISPEAMRQAKHRWRDRIAFEMCDDGPPPSEALRKPADNAINTKNYSDGSGLISMHASPAIYAGFKNFGLHMLNFNGTPPELPDDLIDLLRADDDQEDNDTATNDQNSSDESSADRVNNIDDVELDADPDEPVAEDADGNTITAKNMAGIDQLTAGQKLAGYLIGAFKAILSMDPAETTVKKSHGASAQLMIVQDIQTAHHTLGFPALPPPVQRPPGPAGILPPIITRPNPDDPTSANDCDHGTFEGYVNPVPWTPFQSEIVNHGPIHPKDTETLACDAELVGQIWNGPDIVLKQKRTQRFFTPAQRRAILARDKGCQAPSCTTPAVYCDVHHIKEWLNGGKTDEKNATTLCPTHHAAIHIGKWTIRKKDGLTFFQPAPWLDPYQPLLRNIYWNT